MKSTPSSQSSFAWCPRLLLPLLIAISPLQAKEEWLNWIPGDAVMVFHVPSNSQLRAGWEVSPFGKFLEDPATRKWLAPMMDEQGRAPWDLWLSEQTERDLQGNLELYQGGIMGALFWVGPIGEGEEPAMLVLTEVLEKEAELTELAKKSLEAKIDDESISQMRTREIGSVVVHELIETDDEEDDGEYWVAGWTVVNGTLIQSNDENAFEECIGAALGTVPELGTVQETSAEIKSVLSAENDLFVYANLQQLMNNLLDELNAKAAELGDENPMAMFPPEAIFASLGLTDFRSAALSLNLKENGDFCWDGAVLNAEGSAGFLPKLIRGSSTEVTLPTWVPDNPAVAAISRYSMLAFYDSLIEVVAGLGPMVSGMVQMQLNTMEQSLGIKIRDDLIALIDDEIVQVSEVASDGSQENMVLAFKLKDGARFKSSVDALKTQMADGFSALDEVDYEGHKIFKIKAQQVAEADPSQPVTEMAFTITPDHFLFSTGSTETLFKALNGLDGRGSSGLIWERTDVKTLLAELPADYTGVSISQGHLVMKLLLGAVTQLTQLAQSGAGAALGIDDSDSSKIPDANAVPDESVLERYFGLGGYCSYNLPNGVRSVGVLKAPVQP